METLIQFLTGASLLMGSLFILIAAIGLLRMPDVLCRSHAVAKAMTLGIVLMFVGLLLHLPGDGSSGLKTILAICFQLLTIPVSSHLLCLLARETNLPRWRKRPEASLPESREAGRPE